MAIAPLKRVLRKGAKGLDVAAVHIGLRRAGHPVKLGRYYTQHVSDQMKHFQHSVQLHADGVYGAETHAHLWPHFNRYARHLYRLASADTDVRKLSRVQAAQKLEHYYAEHRYTPDRIEDLWQIRATAEGKSVRNWLGQYVYLDAKVLQALCFLIEHHQRIGTYALCSDHFFDGYHGHGGGHAVDISQIKGVEVTSSAAKPLVLAVAHTLRSGMPKGLEPWQLICGGYANKFDPDITALTIPGAWFYGGTTMSQHRNHLHLGYY